MQRAAQDQTWVRFSRLQQPVDGEIQLGVGQRVGAAGRVGQTTAGDLGQREGNVKILPGLDHEEGEIVGRHRLFRLDRESFPIAVHRCGAVTLRLLQGAQEGQTSHVRRVVFGPLLPLGHGFGGIASADLGPGVGNNGCAIGRVELHCLFRRGEPSLGISGSRLKIGEQVVHIRVLRRLGDLFLHPADGLGRLFFKHKSGCDQTQGSRGVWVDNESLFEQGHGLGDLLLDQAQLRQFQISS